MLTKLRAAGLVWATIWMVPALAVLMGLGTWQLQRKAWKDGLVAAIKARTSAAPTSLDDVLKRLRAGEDVEYTRVAHRGAFLHMVEQHFYAPSQTLGPGYNVYTPLALDPEVRCADYVFVNRGFVPQALKDNSARPAGSNVVVKGGVEVIGLLRSAEKPGMFTPANDAKNNLWFWRDLDAMAAAIRPIISSPERIVRCGSDSAKPLPFFLDAEAEPANPGGWPKGGTTIVEIPNRHLDYAVTWYGLALALIGVFGVYARARLRGLD